MVFESLTTFAKTDDDKNFRFPESRKLSEKEYGNMDKKVKEEGEASSLVSSQEVQEWCTSGLLLPIITNLDTLDMAMIKTLITKEFAGDFFNMGGVPVFKREQVRNALASAIQMVSTSESASGKGEEERAAQAEVANGCFTGAGQNTNLPKPNESLVHILKTTNGGKNNTNGTSYDGPLINEYGRPTNSAVSLIQDFDSHLEAVGDKTEDDLVSRAKSSLDSIFSGKASKIEAVTPTQMSSSDMDIPTVRLANALATARLAGNDLDETLIMRFKTEGFSKNQIQIMLEQINKDMIAERYAPEFLNIEGASSAAVIKALRRLQEAYTNPDPKFDAFVKRMVLIRRLLTGEDMIEAGKGKTESEKVEDKRSESLRKVLEQQSPEAKEALEALKKDVDRLDDKYIQAQERIKTAKASGKDTDDLEDLQDEAAFLDRSLKKKRSDLENAFQNIVSSETNDNPNPEEKEKIDALKKEVEEAKKGEDETLIQQATARLDEVTKQIATATNKGVEGAMKYLRDLQKEGRFGEVVRNILAGASLVKLPPVVLKQLEGVRDFQVGLGTRGIFKLTLDDECAVRGIVINSHYWLTSGLFVQSGAVGDFSNVCSTIAAKLFSYSQDKGGISGRYKVSQVRSALANAISSGPETKESVEKSKSKGWSSGGGRKRKTRRRRKAAKRRQTRRGRRRRR